MSRLVTKDGRAFDGTDTQIVKQMQGLAFGMSGKTVAEYAAWVTENTIRSEGVALQISGETDDEIAASLLGELCLAGLAFWE